MGVLNCNRNNCGNIMCDRHSHEHGYICNECFAELVASGPTTNIDEFMASKRVEYRAAESFARYDVVFPIR